MKLIKNIQNKINFVLFSAFCFLYQLPIKVLADTSEATGDAAAEQLKQILTNGSGTGLLDILEKAGYVIIVFGIGKMIFAFKDDSPDGKAQGSMVLLAGFFIVFLRKILNVLWAGSPV